MSCPSDTTEVPTYARLFAEWWGDILRSGRAPSLVLDAAFPVTFGSIYSDFELKQATAQNTGLTEEQIQFFEQTVAKTVEEMLMQTGHACMGTDYSPEPVLGECLAAAGIQVSLPYKHVAWASEDAVHVRAGYRNEYYLAQTKRLAIRNDVRERLALRSAADRLADRGLFDLIERRYTRLACITGNMPPVPTGNFEALVETTLEHILRHEPAPPLTVTETG